MTVYYQACFGDHSPLFPVAIVYIVYEGVGGECGLRKVISVFPPLKKSLTPQADHPFYLTYSVKARMGRRQGETIKDAKDGVEACMGPGVVHAIGCSDCAASVYIGEAMRTAAQRTREQKAHAN